MREPLSTTNGIIIVLHYLLGKTREKISVRVTAPRIELTSQRQKVSRLLPTEPSGRPAVMYYWVSSRPDRSVQRTHIHTQTKNSCQSKFHKNDSILGKHSILIFCGTNLSSLSPPLLKNQYDRFDREKRKVGTCMYVCMYVCMVITYSRVWINRVRLPILLVVS